MKLTILAILLVLLATAYAGFWDDLVQTVSEKVNAGAEFVQKEALPAISQKFSEVKKTVDESELPDQVHDWAKNEAAPRIADGWEKVKEFVNQEVAPRAKKVYDAAMESPHD